MAARYIFVTGGVISSLGKGITSASLAVLFQAQGMRVSVMKLDPYLNIDPGTMNPDQHGEVFVTEDGGETDLDLGHYERFLGVTLTKFHSVTAGSLYAEVLDRERRGDYLGSTVQVIPHITDMIRRRIEHTTEQDELSIIEIGGTVGDIESLPFLEAVRQMRLSLGGKRTCFVHLTWVPYVGTAGEVKTKPAQHSVKTLCSLGIQPDFLICRCSIAIAHELLQKISLFTNVPQDHMFQIPDLDTIYAVPLCLHEQRIETIMAEHLSILSPESISHVENASETDTKKTRPPDRQAHRSNHLSSWYQMVDRIRRPVRHVQVGLIGKYNSRDAYKSIQESCIHVTAQTQIGVDLIFIDAETIDSTWRPPEHMHGFLIAGGFGLRGMEGKLHAIRLAHNHRIPILGICLGMQLMVIDWARFVLNWKDADSTEWNPHTSYPVVTLLESFSDQSGMAQTRTSSSHLGGTMRLGGYTCSIKPHTLLHRIYQNDQVIERHRHRYEINPDYLEPLQASGLELSGIGYDAHKGHLVEVVENPRHPFWIGCQFHPELTSKITRAHPLFVHWIQAAWARMNQESHHAIV